MKKFVSLLLAMVMTLAISVPAFAAEPSTVSENDVEIVLTRTEGGDYIGAAEIARETYAVQLVVQLVRNTNNNRYYVSWSTPFAGDILVYSTIGDMSVDEDTFLGIGADNYYEGSIATIAGTTGYFDIPSDVDKVVVTVSDIQFVTNLGIKDANKDLKSYFEL
jgi:hypothetical protein